MSMNRVELARGVYYVGAVDWTVRDFHGYTTPRGVTYNAYLVVDEKIALIDTVKASFAPELIESVSRIVDLKKIDYMVVNHIEPDHSSALPIIMEKMPQAKVVITEQGKAGLLKHYGQTYDFQVVKEGDFINLGSRKLRFLPVPMLHWPDSMVSYLEGDEILFSNDAFGQHICTSHRFDDENDISEVLYEAAKYYANILMPFGRLIPGAVAKLSPLPIKLIAPSHGVVWRTHIAKILERYEQWSGGCWLDKVLIVYDTMWGGTEAMARHIFDGVASTGAQVKLFRMTATDRSEFVRELLDARGLIVGSSTLNNGMLPNIAAMLHYLKGLKPTNKIGAAFGAFGWSGGAQKDIEAGLQAAGIKVDAGGLTLKWVPDEAELEKCFEFGRQFGLKACDRS